MRRPLSMMLVVAAVLAVLAPQATAEPRGPDLTWGKCPPSLIGIDDPRLLCATLPVPLDYRDPKGHTIDIQVSKLETAKPDKRRGVLLHNAGGPGGPSLHLPAAYAGFYPQEVLDQYDLVSFDPRGVGYSAPVTCGRTPQAIPSDRYFPFPTADGSITRNVEFAQELARDCVRHSGDLMPFITTANTARDMDRLRIALGEKKISYNSGSYGSYLGAVYATLFADKTDRFVMGANVDPNRVWHKQWALWDHGFELRFADVATWLAERNATYGLGATPDAVRAKYFELVAKLDAKPVTHPQAGPINGNLFRFIVFALSYHTVQFPQQAQWWVFADGGTPPSAAATAVPEVPADNPRASQLAVLCGDGGFPRDIQHYQREVNVHRKLFPLLNGMGTNIWPCAFTPGSAEPPVKVTGKGPANILLVQTLRDHVTPYIGALGMRYALGQRSKMVTVNTGNHGAYDRSTPSCATRAADQFLATGVLPARDMFCEPDSVPPTATDKVNPLLLNW
ncbi:alpha/beta hydrolase [Kibdelosporangium aridum]|uniref:Alpha/beta hydrolase fold n=1 Tax=Kibdelosporangium aridum TaxID=2030 RepID=A0A1W2FA23_KIBAR|nr:alpha/beta hydrolase [Kibdelosporangium aridum]SMD18745.1 alpha/beta hydrolase fold [Kibdelosporangium aridum]